MERDHRGAQLSVCVTEHNSSCGTLTQTTMTVSEHDHGAPPLPWSTIPTEHHQGAPSPSTAMEQYDHGAPPHME